MNTNSIKTRLLAAAMALASLAVLLGSCTGAGSGETTTADHGISEVTPSCTEPTDTYVDPESSEHTSAAAPATTAAPITTPEPELTLAELPAGTLHASHAVIYDVTEHRAIYLHNTTKTDRIYPASTTKLFTAWLALQYLDPAEVVAAGDELDLLASDASIAYIKKGHCLTAEMLVEAMLLPSGGDAAYVIAAAAGRKIAKSNNITGKKAISTFVDEMNRRLASMGLNGTHFSNPDGYHADDHYSTLEDMAAIGALALDNATIMKYAVLKSDRVVYASGQTNTWTNTNELIDPESISYCAEAIGLKTGSTDEAGYCVMTATRGADGRYYIIGVFGSPTGSGRFFDAATLIKHVLNLG